MIRHWAYSDLKARIPNCKISHFTRLFISWFFVLRRECRSVRRAHSKHPASDNPLTNLDYSLLYKRNLFNHYFFFSSPFSPANMYTSIEEIPNIIQSLRVTFQTGKS